MENMYFMCIRGADGILRFKKNFKINKNIRIAALIICTVLTLILSILIYYESLVPHYEEEKVALYRYSNKTNIDHQVSFLPNDLYDNIVPPNGIYITNFLDRINTSFQYQFVGESEADIKGSYKVVAEIEGYTGEKESYKTIWKKLFTLIPETSFQNNTNELSIREDIPIKLTSYSNFANEIIEASKINSQLKLTVFMNVNLQANTTHGVIEERVSPSIIIPLNTNYFEITKVIPETKEAAIEETRQVKVPINKNLTITYSIVLALVTISLFCLSYLTVGVEKDLFIKALNKLFKKHGSRLVALNTNIKESVEQYINVRDIEDLVRIADELGKPIMYKYSTSPEEISQFYVHEENTVYLFDLQDKINGLETEKAVLLDKKKSKQNKEEDKNITT